MTATAPASAKPAVRTLTPAQVQEYHDNGFVIVKSLYTPEQAVYYKSILKGELKECAQGLVSGVKVWMAPVLNPEVCKLMAEPNIVAMLNQLLGPDLEFLSGKAVFKSADTTFGSPWHQDWFYWEGATKLSVWIALDDATPENGCLMFAPGTHKKVFKKYVADGNAFVNRITDADLAEYKKVDVAVKKGDAVIFHDLAAHASHDNTAKIDRWSFISTYRSGAELDIAKVWEKGMLITGKSVNPTFPNPY
jgi:phytanoyl-CoA hydroxylase